MTFADLHGSDWGPRHIPLSPPLMGNLVEEHQPPPIIIPHRLTEGFISFAAENAIKMFKPKLQRL